MQDWIILLIIGLIEITLGLTGFGMNRRRTRWYVSLVGETGYKLTHIILGVIILVLALFVVR